MIERPLLLCYDGSEDAKHAIREAAAMFGPRRALVLAVWQDAAALPPMAWADASLPDLDAVFAAAREGAGRIAEEGAGIARAVGFDATPLVAEAGGPIWDAVRKAADAQDALAVLVGSRGHTGLKSVLLGSVSSGVVHHARRPTVVVRRADG